MERTAILIDDDQDDLMFMKEAIKSVDASILCISFIYPEEAFRVISKELIFLPTFIFMDINMPGMRGDQLLKEFRQNPGLDKTIITMISTSIPDSVSVTLKMAGANHTCLKPTRMEDYYRLLTGILNQTVL